MLLVLSSRLDGQAFKSDKFNIGRALGVGVVQGLHKVFLLNTVGFGGTVPRATPVGIHLAEMLSLLLCVHFLLVIIDLMFCYNLEEFVNS